MEPDPSPISPVPNLTAEEKQKSITALIGLLVGFWICSFILEFVLVIPTDMFPELSWLLGFATITLWGLHLGGTNHYIALLTTKAAQNICAYLCVMGQLINFALLVLYFQVKDPKCYVLVMMWMFVVQWTTFAVTIISWHLRREKMSDLESGIVGDVEEMEIGTVSQVDDGMSTESEGQERMTRECACEEDECEHQTLMSGRVEKEEVIFDSLREHEGESTERSQREKDEEDLGERHEKQGSAERVVRVGSTGSTGSTDGATSDESDSDRSFVQVGEHKGQ
ncbi:hypothetical protein DL98DRAFT_641474 [Cadophora sp. DSE1049]|nr:hypothetical protein DL98DRAFT_641474 [Cadophora sp. DSE1049]